MILIKEEEEEGKKSLTSSVNPDFAKECIYLVKSSASINVDDKEIV